MKTFFRRLALTFGALLALLVLFHLVENWRGRRAWRQWRQAREAAGGSYDRAALIPPEVPDAENFARAPGLAQAMEPMAGVPQLPPLPVLPTALVDTLRQWKMGSKADLPALKAKLKLKDFQEILAPWEGELTTLTEAAHRPKCRLLRDYRDPNAMPALLGMRSRGRALALRALVALGERREAAALEDVLTGLRVAAHLQQEPHLLTALLRTAWVDGMLQPIWEGLQDHRWNGPQLLKLQEALAPIDLVASMARGWRMEQIYVVNLFEQAAEGPLRSRQDLESILGEPRSGPRPVLDCVTLFPKGWMYQNLCRLDQYYVTHFLGAFDPAGHRIHVQVGAEAAFRRFISQRGVYSLLARRTLPLLIQQNFRVARAQSGLDLAVLACALERHKLERGRYPASLAALVPAYLAKPPVDVVEGQPLSYTLQPSGTYTLYSLGWNQTDEKGVAMAGTEANPFLGDWVWTQGK